MNCALATTSEAFVIIFLLLSGGFGMLHGMGDFFKLAQVQIVFAGVRLSLAFSIVVYALSVFLVLAAMKLLPLPSILLLFLLSALHFGETELKSLKFRTIYHRLPAYSVAFALGAPILLLPLLFQASSCHEIFCWLGVNDFPFGDWKTACEALLLLVCTCFDTWCIDFAAPENRRRILFGLFFYCLLIFAHPLLSFSFFFVFRHSVDEIKALLEDGVVGLPPLNNFWRALPLVSAVMIIFVVLYFPVAIDTSRFKGIQVALVFSILLALTPAHVAVGLMFDRQNCTKKNILSGHRAGQC